jgi:hypothetical protein
LLSRDLIIRMKQIFFNLYGGGNVCGSRSEILGSVGFLAPIMELVEKTES